MSQIIVSKEERLARAEKITESARAERLDVLEAAYKKAVETGDETAAADAARALRNKLLDESDKEMSLDRLGLDVSSATRFISSLASIFSGAWAKYRQALRDLPQQAGFPFNIEFPIPPDGNGKSDG